MRPQSMTSNFLFSSLVAGSSRRRRMMMNELVVQRLNLTDDDDEREKEQRKKEQPQEESLSTIDDTLFSQLISLSEPEQTTVEENKVDSRQFDHLLEKVPGIAEIVNSFTSAKIQREVIEALVSAYEQEQSISREVIE